MVVKISHTFTAKEIAVAQYRLWKTSEDSAPGGHPSRFGIALYVGEVPVRIIEDVCLDSDRLSGLIRLFNEEELDPIHLDQAVEDFLYDDEV